MLRVKSLKEIVPKISDQEKKILSWVGKASSSGSKQAVSDNERCQFRSCYLSFVGLFFFFQYLFKHFGSVDVISKDNAFTWPRQWILLLN